LVYCRGDYAIAFGDLLETSEALDADLSVDTRNSRHKANPQRVHVMDGIRKLTNCYAHEIGVEQCGLARFSVRPSHMLDPLP
jgi:hypothetical protein